MPHFHIQDLTFSYPGSSAPVLKNVTLSIRQGEYVALCGKSGSGKTTLLRHLKTVLTPHGDRTGEILFDDIPLEQVSPATQASKIGFVMQNPEEQIVTNKVWHELSFGLENIGCDPTVMRTRVAEMACYFGIGDWFAKDVSTLSGGQKQLLNLASVMAMQPELLILDEPTSMLDPLAASDFLNTIRKINLELGTTIIISEHRLEDVLHGADRVIVMDEGQVVVNDAPRAAGRLLWQQKNPMFAAMPTPVQVFYRSGEQGDCPLTVREGRVWLNDLLPQGAAVPSLPESAENPSGEIALQLKELWFRYERNSPDVLRGASLCVPTGSFHAIVGGNGAGKSTLLKAICGICKPYRGNISIFGKSGRAYKAGELFRNCVAMLPQDPKSLFARDTVAQELQEMCKDDSQVAQVAALCRIDHLLERHPYDLSGGEQQRTALAKVLLTEPRLLLLDEPTKGIDSFFKETLADILCKLKTQGTTIIMVSHDVEFCARFADRVCMFFDGQVISTQTPRRFFGGNSFYTTSANRISRSIFRDAVTADQLVQLVEANREAAL